MIVVAGLRGLAFLLDEEPLSEKESFCWKHFDYKSIAIAIAEKIYYKKIECIGIILKGDEYEELCTFFDDRPIGLLSFC